MRIVGGRWAGRALTSPADARVRPTAEYVRAALLDLLGPELTKARVLDLFAGTGALGLEALSRGAAAADFVETRPASLHALRANVAALHVRPRTRIFKRDAIPFAAALEPGRYDLAFADPPYGSRMVDRIVQSWLACPFARVLAVEHDATQALPHGAVRPATHHFGDTAITIYRAAGAASAALAPGRERPAPRKDPVGKRPAFMKEPRAGASGPAPGGKRESAEHGAPARGGKSGAGGVSEPGRGGGARRGRRRAGRRGPGAGPRA